MNIKFNILNGLSVLLHTLNGYFNPTTESSNEMDNQSNFAWNWLITSGFLLVWMLISSIFLYVVNNTNFGAIIFFGFSWYLTQCITHYRENESIQENKSKDTSTDDSV